ncbi:MAG TPA: alpha/beta hydrolase [Cytophagales bacterium]|nr:alpha/beta hydrolase [Cytophagales bacterium]
MLLIPGLASHGSVWDATVARYQSEYECHVVTLPGFAGQPALEELPGEFLEGIRDELLAYLHAKKLKNVTVVGHSLGGYMALSLASTEPERFGQLIVVDGLPWLPAVQMPGATEESIKPIAENMRNMMNQPRSETFEAQQRIMMTSMVTAEEDIETSVQWSVDSDPATVAQAMYELWTHDLRDDIAVIKAPTLVLGAWIAYKDYGATHQSVKSAYSAQFTQLEGTELYLTDKGKHFIMWDDEEFFFEHLDRVLVAAH